MFHYGKTFITLTILNNFIAGAYDINPKNEPDVLVNDDDDEDLYHRGRLSPRYFFRIGREDFVDAHAIEGLATDVEQVTSLPVVNERVLFQCGKKFKIGGKRCDRNTWVQGTVLSTKGNEVEALTRNCQLRERFWNEDTEYNVVKFNIRELRRADSNNFRRDVVCSRVNVNIFYRLHPNCGFFKFATVFPSQSLIKVEYVEDHGRSQMIRILNQSDPPKLVPDIVPKVKDLENLTEVIVKQESWSGEEWTVGQLTVSEDSYYEVVVEGLRQVVSVDDREYLRILRGRVMTFCENDEKEIDENDVKTTTWTELDEVTESPLSQKQNMTWIIVVVVAIVMFIFAVLITVCCKFIVERRTSTSRVQSDHYEEMNLPELRAKSKEAEAKNENTYESIESTYENPNIEANIYSEVSSESGQYEQYRRDRSIHSVAVQQEYAEEGNLPKTDEYYVYDTDTTNYKWNEK